MRTRLQSYPYIPHHFDTLNFGRDGWRKGHPRLFVGALDGSEMADIRFILEKLSKESWLQLLRLKKELRKRGEKLDHVHPFSFFIGVLSSCNSLFQNLKKRGGLPYSEFVKGAVESFHDEQRHGNITDHQMVIFSQQTGKSLEDIRHYSNSNNWEGFIHYL